MSAYLQQCLMDWVFKALRLEQATFHWTQTHHSETITSIDSEFRLIKNLTMCIKHHDINSVSQAE